MSSVAFVVAEDFEDSEFQRPFDAVRGAGHTTTVIGSEAGKRIVGKKGKSKTTIDKTAEALGADDFDALVIPGGYSPDKLRLDADVVAFVRDMMASGKPVAAICHAAQLLVEADALEGRTLTSWPSVKKDVENAGGTWVDKELVEDDNLITSRKPDDLDTFCAALLRRLQ